MAHTRNGRAAKARRQERANDRNTQREQFFELMADASPEDRLLMAIFGSHEECEECHNFKLMGADCMTPHCKKLRGETSVFYDEITEDSITIKGAAMEAGIDY